MPANEEGKLQWEHKNSTTGKVEVVTELPENKKKKRKGKKTSEEPHVELVVDEAKTSKDEFEELLKSIPQDERMFDDTIEGEDDFEALITLNAAGASEILFTDETKESILDTECSKDVSGIKWFKNYVKALNDDDKSKVAFQV